MGLYFKELSWKFDFTSTRNRIEELSAGQTWHGTDRTSFHSVPIRPMIEEYPFSKIESTANYHGFTIANAICRTQFGHSFSTIHTDSFNLKLEKHVTVPFSLNIPLENTTGATTRWYDFSTHSDLKDEETRFPILDNKKFNSPTAGHVTEFLKWCVADYKMASPVIINTAIPHNVDARGLTGSRKILSIWFVNIKTNKLVTWEQSKFLQDITID